MNVTFWLLICLMLLIAIVLLVYPVLKVRQSSSIAYKDSNLNINNEKIKELETDLSEGRIDRQFYQTARDELDKELLIDIPSESRETAAEHYVSSAKRQTTLALIIGIFVPALTLLLYLQLGMHSATDEAFAANQQLPQQELSIEEMTVQLQQRLQKEGGSIEDWIMLGRAHKYKGNNELAADAFKVALEQDANNAQLMLELAEVLALNNERVFTEDSRALILKAYALDPENANTLWFIGVAEFQYGNYRKAIEHLKKLLPIAGGEDEVMKSIVAVVAKSRQALIDAGEEMPELAQILGVDELMAEAQAAAAEVAKTQAASDGTSRSLQVAVDISDQVKNKFSANDVVFVYAKAKQGPRAPLAVERITMAALPVTVVLDDSMAMIEGMNLSAFDELVISARITKSGSAIAQSGDFIGQIEVSKKTPAVMLNIIIDSVVP